MSIEPDPMKAARKRFTGLARKSWMSHFPVTPFPVTHKHPTRFRPTPMDIFLTPSFADSQTVRSTFERYPRLARKERESNAPQSVNQLRAPFHVIPVSSPNEVQRPAMVAGVSHIGNADLGIEGNSQ